MLTSWDVHAYLKMSNLSEEEMSQSRFSFTSVGSHGLINAPLDINEKTKRRTVDNLCLIGVNQDSDGNKKK